MHGFITKEAKKVLEGTLPSTIHLHPNSTGVCWEDREDILCKNAEIVFSLRSSDMFSEPVILITSPHLYGGMENIGKWGCTVSPSELT